MVAVPVELVYYPSPGSLRFYRYSVRDRIVKLPGYFESALEPRFGCAETFGLNRDALRFRPIDHQNRLGAAVEGDWADYLDGDRVESN